MAKSVFYKMVKISVLPVDPRQLLIPLKKPGEIISRIMLNNPSVQDEHEDVLQFGFVGTRRLEDKKHIITGKIVQGRQIEWRHLQKGDVTDKKLADHPYCRFYFSEKTQIAGFQSARLNRGLQAFLRRVDKLLSRELGSEKLYTESKSLKDPTGFKQRLEDAERIQSIWFSMIPPNAYRSAVAREFIQAAVAHTKARQVRFAYDPVSADTLNPNAEVFNMLIEECEEGNGNCGAGIVPIEGAKTEHIKLNQDRIVRKLTPEDIQETGSQAIEQTLRPATLPEGDE
jgi:hypothetical protein